MTFGIPKVIAWLFIILVLNLAALDSWILASQDGRPAQEDGSTSAGAPADVESVADSLTAPQGTGPEAVNVPDKPSDRLILTGQVPAKASDPSAHKGAPLYKRWWFWTAAASAVTAAVVLSVGGREESRRDLPDFPNPPER